VYVGSSPTGRTKYNINKLKNNYIKTMYYDNNNKIDIQYIANVDYDGYSDCHSNGCHEEGICRCYKIENAKIIGDIDRKDIRGYLLNKSKELILKDEREIVIDNILEDDIEISEYYIDRLITIHKLYDKDSWEILVESSWYGEEISGVVLYEEKSFLKDFYMLYSSSQELIFYMLEKEYNELTNLVIGRKWRIETIDKSKLFIPQKNHYDNIKRLDYYSDENYNLPRGIAVYDEYNYRLVDGYHRVKNTDKDTIELIVGY
jgi:hypothetical protein